MTTTDITAADMAATDVMTAVDVTAGRQGGGGLVPAERQAAARDAYRQAAAGGRPPTGAELGHQFGRSARWGRDRIAEARTTTGTPTTDRRPAASDTSDRGSRDRDRGSSGQRGAAAGNGAGHSGSPAVAASGNDPGRADRPAAATGNGTGHGDDDLVTATGNDSRDSGRQQVTAGNGSRGHSGHRPVTPPGAGSGHGSNGRVSTTATGGKTGTSSRPAAAADGDGNDAGGSQSRTTAAGSDADGSAAGAAGVAVEVDGLWSRRVIRWVTTAAVIVVAACAARSSYEHQRMVVELAGNHQAAWYLPLSVDGMMLIASLNMLVRRWDNEPAGRLTWTALLLGGAASLAANIAAAQPTWIGRLVAAWSPICLIVSYELLMQQLPNRTQPLRPED
jgi:hypothetical protein